MDNAETFTVESKDFAQSMMTIDDWKRLAVFMEERSLSEAAEKLSVSLSQLSYHVNKWLESGVLCVVREEKRAGRAVKIYRTTHQRFFIPFALTSSATVEEMMLDIARPVQDLALRETARILRQVGDGWGVLWQQSEQAGGVVGSISPQPGSAAEDSLEVLKDQDGPTAYFNLAKLNLTHDSAKALQKDLLALHDKYQALQDDEAQPYIVQLGVTALSAEAGL